MDSDDEVLGAGFRAQRSPQTFIAEPEGHVKEDATQAVQNSGKKTDQSDAETAALMNVIWARVKGFPSWPVSSAF